MNNLHSFQSCVSESFEPNKLDNVFKQILGTRYLMAPGLWHWTWYGSTSDRMPLCFSVCVCDCVCVRGHACANNGPKWNPEQIETWLQFCALVSWTQRSLKSFYLNRSKRDITIVSLADKDTYIPYRLVFDIYCWYYCWTVLTSSYVASYV